MKFTNNRKKAINLSAKSPGRYNWENASVVFEKEIRNKKDNPTGAYKTRGMSVKVSECRAEPADEASC